MARKISRICFADDDLDDHLIFSTAVREDFPAIYLNSFYHCKDLLAYLNDDINPLPDLIFLDYNMPGNDGNECLKYLKNSARLLHIPVIMYSTSDREDGIRAAKEAGAYRYVVKPYVYDGVRKAIRGIIEDFEQRYSK